jgi:uncharacterized protein
MKKKNSKWKTAIIGTLVLFLVLPLVSSTRGLLVEKLCVATMSGNTGEMHKYLNMGADINGRDKSGQTPLTWAAVKGNAHATQILLERGADVNLANTQGDSPLMWAAVMGFEQVVELILENNPDVNFMSKENGVTALMAAAAKGHTEVVRLLVNCGAEVNTKDHNQNTALMHATTKRFPEVVNTLLCAGATYRGSKPTSTLSALLFVSPEGEFKGLELYQMGDVKTEDRQEITDAYLRLAPHEISVLPLLETRLNPFLHGGEQELPST